jgi:NAD(P) transhydrogenase
MYDLIVIGSGPAGEGAAIAAKKCGLKVAIIEGYDNVGGNCTFNGTIPSKALRYIVSRALEINASPIFNPLNNPIDITPENSLQHAKNVIAKQVKLRTNTYHRNEVDIIHGQASFIDENTLSARLIDGTTETFKAKNIVIATGSSPYRPEDIDFKAENIYDSTSILALKGKPRTMIIYGAGVIGCEYASIFDGLGIKVTLINTRSHLLEFLDREVSSALNYHFSSVGIRLKHEENYKKITSTESGVLLELHSGKRIKADCLLFANGRTGNTSSLSLGKIGIKPDSRGLISVNSHYQTVKNGIYAIGDVIGLPSLASASFGQGHNVGKHIGNRKVKLSTNLIPTGIYTIPEISSIGKTEEELTAEKVPYEVGKAQYQHLASAQIGDFGVGFLKILFDPITKKILGIHSFGERSSEIIHIGQGIMDSDNLTVEYFANNTFNYPTMAEAYRIAALNGLNKLF